MSTKIVKIAVSGNKLFSFGPMHVFRDRQEVAKYRASVQSLGFVATMGALHAGHLSLVTASGLENDETLVSIFVNPAQFNSKEDLDKYPRDVDADLEMLLKAGAQAVFVPSVEEMYPNHETTDRYQHEFGRLEEVMEGAYRPGHFRGMAMVVHKFLEMVRPTRAYFGRKDYQQLLIIKEMVRRKGLPVEIKSVPIVRESNGLAMSSRNQRLDAKGKTVASLLFRALGQMKADYSTVDLPSLKASAVALVQSHPEIKLEYLEIADAETLEAVHQKKEQQDTMAFIAAYVNGVRLIDNIALNGSGD